MVHSMTGYGKNELIDKEGNTITAEVRTVNHRFLDVKLHATHSFVALEEEIKQLIQSYFTRGRIDIYLNIEGEKVVPYSVQIDWGLLDQYMNQIDRAKKRYHLTGETPIDMITTIPDLFLVEQTEAVSDEIKDLLMKSVQHACEEVKATRSREGTFLKTDMQNRMQSIYNVVSLLDKLQPTIRQRYSERVMERIEMYVGDSVTFDESRLHQEIALLAEKGDITEEITRLKSHITHCLELFSQHEPIGRKLEFIVQEIHREINTIGSKSIDEQMSRMIVQAKGELEKIREQIQNIE